MNNKLNSDIKKYKYLKQIPIFFLLILLVPPSYAENKAISAYEEQFLTLYNNINKSISICGNDKNCIKSSIKKLIEHIPDINKSKLSEVVRDARVGLSFLNVESISNIFYDDFGIDEKSFTGTGLSVPTPSYNDIPRGVVEYWSPNVNETEPMLWTWKMPLSSLSITEKTVSDVIANIPPFTVKNNDKLKFSGCLDYKKQNDNSCTFKKSLHDEKLPILFRCAQFDEKKYTGLVGRNEAKRVFFTRLSDVFDISIYDACSQTDRKVKKGDDDSKQVIFFWVFIPTQPDQVVPATWGNLFKYFAKWENI